MIHLMTTVQIEEPKRSVYFILIMHVLREIFHLNQETKLDVSSQVCILCKCKIETDKDKYIKMEFLMQTNLTYS